MTAPVLALNAGSTSIKFSLFAESPNWPLLAGVSNWPLLAGGAISNLNTPDAAWRITQTAPDLWPAMPTQPKGACDHHQALTLLKTWLEYGPRPAAIIHRIVHGGPDFIAPVRLDAAVIESLRALVPLAPLHQPHHLAALDILQTLWPDMPHYGCFDTAFHAGHAPEAYDFALPDFSGDRLLRRYGFHGLSCAWIAHRLAVLDPALYAGRVVVAHLGGGSSLTAMSGGRSIDSSMGMTALDGVPMTTRCGQIDPGAILYLLRHHVADIDTLEQILYQQSGLRALSGTSGDMKTLLATDSPGARRAISHYVARVSEMIGRMAVVLGGLDGLVFTGGIGEHAAPIRDAITEKLAFLNIPKIMVIPTDEEQMMVMSVIAHLT